jgi:hypothetical protein
MKRILVGFLFLLVLSALLFLLLSEKKNESPPAARLAAADSIIYCEFRDLPESVKRWPETTLSQIRSEPSVARFLSRPIAQIPASWKMAWRALVHLYPTNAYFCCSDWNGKDWVLGARCKGDLRNWQSQIREQVHDLSSYRLAIVPSDPTRNLDSSSESGKPLFAARAGDWLLFSLRLGALRSALARAGNKPTGLEVSDVFNQSRAHLPSDADFYGFFAGTNPGSVVPALEWLPSTSAMPAVMIATKLEGPNIHDTLFRRASPEQVKLAARGMYLTTPKTLMYACLPLDLLHVRDVVRRLEKRWGIAQTARQYLDEVTVSGVDFRLLSETVKGAEIVVNRNPDGDMLDGYFLVEVRDPERFTGMVRKILEQEFPHRWSEGSVGNSPVFRFGVGKTALVFGMNSNYFVLAQNEEAYAEAQTRLLDQRVGIHPPESYRTSDTNMTSSVRFYLDSDALFERGYGSLRPVLVFGAALVPSLNTLFDPATLPETSEISKHLTPILMYRRDLSDGVLEDSVGPVTAYEASAIGVAAAVGLNLLEQ